MPQSLQGSALPAVVVSRRGADRVRAGHVWIYRSDVVQADGVLPGSLVTVKEAGEGARPTQGRPTRAHSPQAHSKRVLGSALYSTASEIAVRMISNRPVDDLDRLVRERVRAAIAYRERFVENTDAYRVIFSEADCLPGLIVDRYNDILSAQIVTQAMDSEQMRSVVMSELQKELKPVAIVERVDSRVRRLEQLAERNSGLLFGDKTSTEFRMNGVRFLYDALEGQKTGAFLDQRENYAAAARYARGEALDVFCYQGAFALHLAQNCSTVTGVDSSRPALEIAEKNAGLNGKEMEWIEANAFDLLRDYADAGRQYDCVVLDPPAFAKSKQNRETALRGYKELNLRALKMIRPGGILVTCSCSYHVSEADLLEVVASAALDSHRILRVLENRGQSKDHPRVLGIPETGYLKCLTMLVS
jgi:23S rRNA (cytosine1962-C5)-methyltransferase